MEPSWRKNGLRITNYFQGMIIQLGFDMIDQGCHIIKNGILMVNFIDQKVKLESSIIPKTIYDTNIIYMEKKLFFAEENKFIIFNETLLAIFHLFLNEILFD